MRKRFFLHFIILIIIGLTITGFFSSQLMQTYYKKEAEARLRIATSLINFQLSNSISNSVEINYNKSAKEFSDILNKSYNNNGTSLSSFNMRVTFIDFSGKVVGESNTDYLQMENHFDRKEVQQAIQGSIGKDIRFSKTLEIDFLYVAMPLKSADIIVRISVPLVELKKIDQTIWQYTVMGIVAGFILTTLLAYKFSSYLTQPINELSNMATEISSGNYSKRIHTSANDELGKLSETFNQMTIRLEKTVSDLKNKNIEFDSIMNSLTNGIFAVDTKFRIILINEIACQLFGVKGDHSNIIGTNILELVRNNQIISFIKQTIEKDVLLSSEITIAHPDERILKVFSNPIKPKDSDCPSSGVVISFYDITNIRKLEQIRTDFVSNVTHELKTPLTSIRGFIETLRNGAMDDSEVADKFLEIIDIEAERLYMLINDILQLSEIETMHKDSNIGVYQLESIIDEIVSILEGVASKKGVKLSYQVEPDMKIEANRNRIKQMLINLVDNAIKYNVENGSVLIQAFRCQGKIVISVKDTGIGISQGHISRIFERFYRVDKGRSRNMGGTGLGLSIVKHIVNLYNGDIKVHSTPGKGTEFIIFLPV